jgi:hypothetical protein
MKTLLNRLIVSYTLLSIKPWNKFCLHFLIILSIRLYFINHVYADSWYNLSYWIDLSDQLCRIDQAMGYYPENESIKPYSTTQKEPENENSIINASYDEQAALVNTQINDLVLLSQRQLTIDELLKVLPAYTDDCYTLSNIKYFETYEYQLLEAAVRETKSPDLLNILAILNANYLIYNEYLIQHPKDPIGLQYHLITKAIAIYSREMGI